MEKQKLVDIVFAVALLVNSKDWKRKSNEETAKWVAKQLRECGFETGPCGASWGILKNK